MNTEKNSNEKKYLEIQERDTNVKAKALRNEMKVPGVIYGGTIEGGQPIYIDESVLNEFLKKNTKSSVIPAKYKGTTGSVIVKEVIRDNMTLRVNHIDLQAISRNEVLTFDIPVTFLGEENILHKKLLLNINLNTISVKGPANKVPETIEVEVGDLNMDDKLFTKDIKLPESVELLSDPDELLVSISQSKMEQDLETIEEEAQEAMDAQAPETEDKEENKEADSEEAPEEK